ncbi:hypothetical protein [Persephonella sp. IF05-L8]|uniref:hypothetical protein n=1 Tax=Persephonella sp. IF05-L8 TaxID=1158338 RepID=UPI0018CBF6E3
MIPIVFKKLIENTTLPIKAYTILWHKRGKKLISFSKIFNEYTKAQILAKNNTL